jgi:hypothetical protein
MAEEHQKHDQREAGDRAGEKAKPDWRTSL